MEGLHIFLPSLTYPMGLNQKLVVPWNRVGGFPTPVQHCSIQMTILLLSYFEIISNVLRQPKMKKKKPTKQKISMMVVRTKTPEEEQSWSYIQLHRA